MIAKEFETFLLGQEETFLTPAENLAVLIDTHNADHATLLLSHMNDIRIRHDFLAQVMLHLISHNISEPNRPNKLFFICHNRNTGIGHLTKQECRMIRIVSINQHS